VTTIATGLQAAWRLARGRPDGLVTLADPTSSDMAVAARSFWALAPCLPLEIVQAWMNGTAAPHAMAQDVLVALVGWLGFALMSHQVVVATGKAARWPRYIAAWNWCSLLQSLVLVVALLPSVLHVPALLSETIVLVAIGWALWLEYFIARLALAFSPLQAAGLVVLDFAITQVASGLMEGLG
jgi:hypothetical protein